MTTGEKLNTRLAIINKCFGTSYQTVEEVVNDLISKDALERLLDIEQREIKILESLFEGKYIAKKLANMGYNRHLIGNETNDYLYNALQDALPYEDVVTLIDDCVKRSSTKHTTHLQAKLDRYRNDELQQQYVLLFNSKCKEILPDSWDLSDTVDLNGYMIQNTVDVVSTTLSYLLREYVENKLDKEYFSSRFKNFLLTEINNSISTNKTVMEKAMNLSKEEMGHDITVNILRHILMKLQDLVQRGQKPFGNNTITIMEMTDAITNTYEAIGHACRLDTLGAYKLLEEIVSNYRELKNKHTFL